jgi:2-polyprenyl-3-methyl-5-hydroxy-6-metoxy-1,4-benzoquinol methylase
MCKALTVSHSKTSSRYDSGCLIRQDAYDRTWVLLKWIGTGKRVLEVGCSTGYMSRNLAQRNCSVTGLEVDPDAAKIAGSYCKEILIRDLNSADWMAGINERAFDIVLFGDVLEHLVDPATVLMKIRPLLDVDGSVVISLPNVVHWITRLNILLGQFDYQSTGTLDHTHLRFFTLKTAKTLIEDSGFQITSFHPAIGGRMSGYFRPAWQHLARLMPGVFAYQLLFEAKPA